jgi:GNAT superfamily N-acetyltransferase
MDLRPLEPKDLADWLAYFDGPAFADNKEWGGCYCRAYLFAGEGWDEACATRANREVMCGAVGRGEVDGILARDDGRVIGWIHMGPRARFTRGGLGSQSDAPSDLAAIVCLLVEASYRRKGVARALLQAACRTLGERGFSAVEAWPRSDETNLGTGELFHGPMALYASEGFTPVGSNEWITVMRRALP